MSKNIVASQNAIRRYLLAGVATIGLLVGGLGGWASTTEFAGAVIAAGQVVVDSSSKKVQHQAGGIVGEIRVREGDRVKEGDLLVRLDETVVRSNLMVIMHSLDELQARQARLEAERDGADTMAFGAELLGRQSDPAVEKILVGEQRLFELRKMARMGQKSQLRERTTQLQEEITGLQGQIDAKASEIQLIARELEGVRELYQRKLIQLTRLTSLEREQARLSGEKGQLIAGLAQTRGRISEIGLQIIQIDQDLRSEVAKELRELQAKVAELIERRVAAEDQLKRVDVRAPISGIVHQLATHTVGGVISPGEVMMLIVPEGDDLALEVRIAPQDRDQIEVGAPVTLRFTAFNQRTTPELFGSLSRVSPDLTTDQRSGASYYTARVSIPPEQMDNLKPHKLVPGMPVEAFLQTNMRTVASFLLKPLGDQVTKSFRQ